MPSKNITLKQLSIRNRLFLAACFWLGGMIVLAGVGIPKLVNDYLVDNATIQLNLAMDEIAGNLTLNAKGKLSLSENLSDPRFKKPYSGLYWNVTGATHQLRSRSLWDKNIEQEKPHKTEHLIGANGEKLVHISQIIYIPDVSEPLKVIVGIDRDPLEETLEEIIGQLWIILLFLFLGILAFIIAQVYWSLRPLSNLHAELQSLEKGDQETIQGDYPKEVSPLISDLNALLFHYQELLQRARNQAGNLSHSIKTPLSILKNQVADLPQPENEQLMQSIEQVQSHINYHMSRARMAGSMNILSVKSNPSPRVDAIAKAFDKVYASRDILLINEIEHDLEVSVEESDLDEMLGNLIENAYKWSYSRIRVSAQLQKHKLLINVEDDGSGIDKNHLKNITKRGFRLDESVQGTGLGLNIVSEMAYSYRGSLEFSKSEMGGLKAILTLASS